MEETKWKDLYSSHIQNEFKSFDEYFRIKMKLKKPFLKCILKYAKDKPILECGCGTGKFSVYLATLGLDVYAIDLEKEMIQMTNELSNSKSANNLVKVSVADARSIPFEDNKFSVTHSSGVLEHYSDEDIVALINEQLRVSDYCIFSVPTKYFDKKMFGNERFMTRKEWREIILKSNAKIIKEAGYHYKTLKNRLVDIIKSPKKIFKPIALYVFVLTKK